MDLELIKMFLLQTVGKKTVSHSTLLITFFSPWRHPLKEKAKHIFQGENCQSELESKPESISMGSFTATQQIPRTQEGKQAALALATLSAPPEHHQRLNMVVCQ